MKIITTALIGAGALGLAKGLDNRIEITCYEPKFKNLPKEFDGFRIVHISDLHSNAPAGLLSEISKLKPDIIVITGDMTEDKPNIPFLPTTHLISRLAKIADVYMVSGNHDIWNANFSEFTRLCEESGARLIDNSFLPLTKGDAQIGLFGVADPYAKATNIIIENLNKSFSLLPDYDGFKLLLFHRANQFDRIKDKGFDLILSGHMHGGHIRIPYVGGLMPPKSSLADSKQIIFPSYCSGMFVHENTTMIVNRGLGNHMIIPRLFNRPEICLTVLRCDSSY